MKIVGMSQPLNFSFKNRFWQSCCVPKMSNFSAEIPSAIGNLNNLEPLYVQYFIRIPVEVCTCTLGNLIAIVKVIK